MNKSLHKMISEVLVNEQKICYNDDITSNVEKKGKIGTANFKNINVINITFNDNKKFEELQEIFYHKMYDAFYAADDNFMPPQKTQKIVDTILKNIVDELLEYVISENKVKITNTKIITTNKSMSTYFQDSKYEIIYP